MIDLVKVTKKFKEKTAVENVSFRAKSGEIIGFVGSNGAGKTTTMRLLLGYLTPTSGKVTIDNIDPVEERIKVVKKIGYLPENNPLYSEMKVEEYLRFIADAKEINDYKRVVKAVSLEDVLKTKIEELSRGYKQRVGLAAALIGDPEILILDEPTSGLDPLEQEKIRSLIKKLTKKTVVFSTHILSEVEEVATRLIIINRGKIVFDGKKPGGKGSVEKLFKKLVA
ncbi:ABC transporter ATP-binding protein [Candidatus Roizmanbacteria bacterium]|jgi:ABC-2 type transport system ATP-binding protein|nr:ABC transporter ATP-binding protein [Candidatus Roizmanbacteria bacterium]